MQRLISNDILTVKVTGVLHVADRMLIKLTSMCQVLRTYTHVGIRSRWVYLTIKSEWFACVNDMCALKTVNCHDANVVAAGSTGGCHGVVMMPTLSSLVAPVVVLTTTGDTSDDKVGIMPTLGFQCMVAKGNMANYCHFWKDYLCIL